MQVNALKRVVRRYEGFNECGCLVKETVVTENSPFYGLFLKVMEG